MPDVSHHWKELKLGEGKVMTASPGKPDKEYLATPEVRIAEKKRAVPEQGEPRVSFFFQLNCTPDAVWQELFATNLEDVPAGIIRPEFKVEFVDNQLRLICLPQHLERIYPFVKTTIEKTNSDYQQEKEKVLTHVTSAEARREPGTPAAEAKADIAREKFTQLEM